MNLNSLNRAFTKRLRLFIATLTGGLLIVAAGQPGASATISIVDSLGSATPTTTFASSTTGGLSISSSQLVGPKFTLTQTTNLTEIGAFVNNCLDFTGGELQCPRTLTVQIRPETNGVPDPSIIFASFALSQDNDPLTVSYESVAINLFLQPGTYFALFVPEGNDVGILLADNRPVNYQAELIELGILHPPDESLSDVVEFPGAVRILGETNVFAGDCDSGISNIELPGGLTIADLVADLCGISN
jgi:hypothetical protein